MNKKLVLQGLLNSLSEVIYVALVAYIMNNAARLFGQQPGIIGNISFLILFVVSAAISGALILGKPILYYIEGTKKQSVELFGYTIMWLVVILISFLTYLHLR